MDNQEEETNETAAVVDRLSPPLVEEKQRGIYSEALAPPRIQSSTNVITSVSPRPDNTFKPLTFARSTSPSKEGSAKGRKKRPTFAEESKYDRTVEPKVQVPYIGKPGKAPRKVAIERLKKQYASEKLEDLLDACGVPESVFQEFVQPEDDSVDFDLGLFDDRDFETRSPEAWLELIAQADGASPGIPAKVNRGAGWIACLVTDWDVDRNCLTISVPEEPDPCLVHRLQVLLLAENPHNFAKRVARAVESRQRTALRIKYNLCIDCMPIDKAQRLDSEQSSRVCSLIYRDNRLKAIDEKSLLSAVNLAYGRAMSKIVFEMRLKVLQSDLPVGMGPEETDERFMLREIFREFFDLENDESDKVASQVVIFDESVRSVITKNSATVGLQSLYTQNGVIRALDRISEECIKAQEVTFFKTAFAKSVKLEEFQFVQSNLLNNTISFLKEQWTMHVKNHVRVSFKDVGKGWFNLKEQSSEVYSFSKLKKFFTLINSMMQDSLRTAAVRNLSAYADFIRRNCQSDVEILSCAVVNFDGDSPPPEIPLFAIDLIIVEDGSGGSKSFAYNVDPEKFVAAPLKNFSSAVNALKGIPCVERQVMDKLFWSFDPMIASVSKYEPLVKGLAEEMEVNLKKATSYLTQYLETYTKHLEFLNLDVKTYLEKVENECADIEETDDDEDDRPDRLLPLDPYKIQTMVNKHAQLKIDIESEIPTTISLGLVSLSSATIRQNLSSKHEEIVESLLQLLTTRTVDLSAETRDSFAAIENKLRESFANIEEVTAQEAYIKTVPSLVNTLQVAIDKLDKNIQVLEGYHRQFDRDDFTLVYRVKCGPMSIDKAVDEALIRIEEAKVKYAEEQEEEQEEFKQTLSRLEQDVINVVQYKDLAKVTFIRNKIKDLRERIDRAETDARRFNSRESLFNHELTDYDCISVMNKDFEPFETLWSTTASWLVCIDEWKAMRFTELDAEEIEKTVTTYHKNLLRSVKLFEKRNLGDIAAIAEEIKTQVEAFKPSVPLVMALRNPGMRDRHWEAINTKLNLSEPLDPADPNFTLAKVLSPDLGLLQEEKIHIVVKTGETSAKEFQIEVALDKMQSEWNEVKLEVVPYKETGTRVLKGVDELQALLDEHVTMTQAMMFSAFKGPFEERIETWDKTLSLVSEVLDEWMAVQRNWLYLQPIFDSEDINKQLPTEGKRFATVDKNWRHTMEGAMANPFAIKFCPSEKLLDRFVESNKFLDMVSKGLSDYLETKRSGFARFYFLSNDELLEILSQTKDPTMVQPHLKKCFEGIKRVEFDENQLITDMFSSEGEKIQLSDPVDPNGANVEDWMTQLDNMMKQSVKEVLFHSVIEYMQIARTEWIQKVPGQCAINGSQLHWTREIEEALEEHGAEGMVLCYNQQVQQINDMVNLVRDPNLGKMARITLSALTVIDVHARDVTEKLKLSGLSHKEEFLWISQMRFYWYLSEVDTTMDINNINLDGNMWVSMVSAMRPYGYEYLGNSFRLVITPLTDKCYLTLMGALQMILGGAPAGPAGTGKTETTKDLAKALAKQCVVFNCSDGLDYLAMGKFFKGLASCGAWACFDEFNRIDVEVLSVVAQQIMTLQDAAKRRLDRIEFEGTMINMNDQFAVFITMNPGYAGRTELPDNLKALFRPVAMMVPDYGLIGEIMLYSFGYGKARKCAQKMVATFRLCSEQLSSQDHYDYGMRAVKTVIVAAGNLKRAEPDCDEEVLLLRALQDVNLPKFLSHDLPLFKGIISDLFPGLKRPDIDYGELSLCLRINTEKLGLQPVPFFMEKSIQLYETIVVRHGLMVVGPTGGGKSRNIECLSNTLGMLKDRGEQGFAFEKVIRHSLNPKSITMGQLYGEFDANTHEWQDGILANLVRDCSKSTTPDRKFIVFDGPVDAIWIENMNTVLDDNKKLCLNSGEIIALSAEISMMFEVEDLEVASPATVSRVGIVYMEPSSLGYSPVQKSWLEALPSSLQPRHLEKLQFLMDRYVGPCIGFLRRNFKEPVRTCNNALNASLLKHLDCYIFPLLANEDSPSKAKLEDLFYDLEAYFIHSLIWSICCTVDRKGRKMFDSYLRNLMIMNSSERLLPEEGSIYDYNWTKPLVPPSEEEVVGSGRTWIKWMDTITPYEFDPNLPFAETIIPTNDSVCYTYLAKTMIENGKHFLMTGPTGTGKSVNINKLISTGLSSEYVPLCLTFSAQTSANQTQDIIDGKTEKRRKGVYGPPAGKRFVAFIDDLNMPKREEYFAQPPIELIRQWFDYEGWYDRKTLTFKKLIDFVMVAAMGPPGGGRNLMTARLKRHYTIINYTLMEESSMELIYASILNNFLTQFDPAFLPFGVSIVKSTISIYQTICTELLPTPEKSHYTYNLRDLGKVFQGLLMISPKQCTEAAQVIRAWVHESRRVFQDRLINEEDRAWFDDQVKEQIAGPLGLGEAGVKEVLGDESQGDLLIYCDFLNPGGDPVYEEATEVGSLLPIVEEYLVDYNAESQQPMNLVMFMDAIKHIARISRVLRQPLGNTLLLGVGGSGRQSLTRLATFIADYENFQVEISKGYGMNEWRDDVKRCLMLAGIEDKQVSFLFVDTQIIDEQMLEDINGILNSGDIPNLYGPDELEQIMNTCRIECQKKRIPPTKINIYSQYLNRVKRNIHMCICMSPGTSVFRDRLRMFPSLVNCCAIDWFSEWPDEALKSVGMGIMQEVDLKLGEHLENIVETFKIFHQGVAAASKDYFTSLRRYNYVTPTSYLELLNTFKILLQKKRVEVGGLVSRLQIGLDKLLSTSEMVSQLQEELTAMQPSLVKTQAEVEAMIVQIDKDKEGAKETMAIVAKEEEEAEAKAAATQAIADDAQRDLDEALPALDQAVACLNKLKKSDLDEVKSLKNPPGGVKLTMEAACIMFGVKPLLKNDPDKIGAKLKDYFGAAQKEFLSNANQFLKDLMEFDKDKIPDKVIAQINPYIEMEDFTPAEIEKASKACTAICMWVRAMHKYNQVAKAVEPKKQQLAEAQAELAETMSSLNDARARLKAVQDKIKDLETEFEKSNAKKIQLENDVEQCAQRLQRAQKLIGGLGGERDRWTSSIAQFNIDYNNLIGDVLISSGAIAYLGPFTSLFRQRLVEEWSAELIHLKLPHTSGVDIIKTLGDPVAIRAWNIFGLPSDEHSTQNGIVMNEARRWPLLIDPQTQANRYIKNMGKDKTYAPNGIEVVKQSDRNLLRVLENGVRFGKWVLMENVGEKLEAALEPILQQSTFKQGSQTMIRLGDSTIPYNDSFKFFMTSKLPNPHYPPEVAVKVSLLNFSITPKGLEDQLLGVVMKTELPEKEEKKNMLVVNNAKMSKELKDIEDTILHMLSNSQGNILDDQELIDTLASSKVTSNEINVKVAEAKVTEKEIDDERENYRPVAFRGSILFFCIADLRIIDPMYEYSLQWFTVLFQHAILNSEHPEDHDVTKRIVLLNEFFTYSLYQNICRSLFEKHKLLFSFSLLIKVMQGDGQIDNDTWRFLLSGQTPNETVTREKPKDIGWLNAQAWAEMLALSTLPAFQGLVDSFLEDANLTKWKEMYDSETCYRDPLPGNGVNGAWNDELNPLEKMCVLRCIRPDKMVQAIQEFICHYVGQKFIEPPPFDIENSFSAATVTTPLIFVLTSGSDPTKDFLTFAEAVGRKVSAISLGQGQGPLAQSLIEQGMSRGSWVLLQNCHLASSWMPELERLVEEIDPNEVHKDFRLWLTSMPTKAFPVSVLQQGVKMTKEPPKGLRANLKSAYYNLDDDKISVTNKPDIFKKLLFGLCFFHALIQERRKFGPLGWNICYEFNDTDLDISISQLELYINKYDEPPYEVLNVLTSSINYGGRVTDAIDLRTIDVILKEFYCAAAIVDGYKYSSSGIYYTIPIAEGSAYQGYLDYIDSLPVNVDPEVFGMHENANITCALAETHETFDTLMMLQPRSSSGGGKSREEVIIALAKEIEWKLPSPFNVEAVSMQYPVRYEESMNTVLVQECIRYQNLLLEMIKSLSEVQKALKGLVVLSSELESMATNMFNQKIPTAWESKAYPCMKPLNAWVEEFLRRIRFIQSWIDNDKPPVYWISGFFFPQAFVTGNTSNYARKHQYPIDTISFGFNIVKEPMEDIRQPPGDGCFVYGMFMEGARFDMEVNSIVESRPKELYTEMPVLHFEPIKDRQLPTDGVYRCPVYKILSRQGTLSTTGHSTNFVMWIEVPSSGKTITNNIGLADQDVWIKAGVAAFLSLQY